MCPDVFSFKSHDAKLITSVFIAGFAQDNDTALSYPLKDSGTIGNLNSSRFNV